VRLPAVSVDRSPRRDLEPSSPAPLTDQIAISSELQQRWSWEGWHPTIFCPLALKEREIPAYAGMTELGGLRTVRKSSPSLLGEGDRRRRWRGNSVALAPFPLRQRFALPPPQASLGRNWERQLLVVSGQSPNRPCSFLLGLSLVYPARWNSLLPLPPYRPQSPSGVASLSRGCRLIVASVSRGSGVIVASA